MILDMGVIYFFPPLLSRFQFVLSWWKRMKNKEKEEWEKCGRDFNSLALYYVNYYERYLILMMSILWLIVVIWKLHRAFDRDSLSFLTPTHFVHQNKKKKKIKEFSQLTFMTVIAYHPSFLYLSCLASTLMHALHIKRVGSNDYYNWISLSDFIFRTVA